MKLRIILINKQVHLIMLFFSAKTNRAVQENRVLEKSNYWKLLSDFNFNYLPSNVSLTQI
jgi:hypothetical protein